MVLDVKGQLLTGFGRPKGILDRFWTCFGRCPVQNTFWTVQNPTLAYRYHTDTEIACDQVLYRYSSGIVCIFNIYVKIHTLILCCVQSVFALTKASKCEQAQRYNSDNVTLSILYRYRSDIKCERGISPPLSTYFRPRSCTCPLLLLPSSIFLFAIIFLMYGLFSPNTTSIAGTPISRPHSTQPLYYKLTCCYTYRED